MNGYIGFFDILGYQSFLENNPQEDAQKNVLGIIASIKKELPDLVKKYRSGLSHEAKKVIDEMKWIIFSDTIVFTIEADKGEDALLCFLIAIITAEDLMTHMFDEGLPLRGALHYGQYNFVENSMAGLGVVQSLKAGENLDLSACVLTEGLVEKVKPFTQDNASDKDRLFWDQQLCDYSVPVSGDKWERRKCLMWFNKGHILHQRLGEGVEEPLNAVDYRQYVHNAFWKHNKKISDEKTTRKLEETERFIRYCVFKHPGTGDAA